MSTPTDEAQDCIGGPCEECDDWGGGTCALCERYFCGNCWSTPAHDCAAALTGAEARELAKRWAFHRGVAEAHVAMCVVARTLRAEGVAAICAETDEQGDMLNSMADAGLMIYEGNGDWALTVAGSQVPSPADHERLFAWVRERVAREYEQAPQRGRRATMAC